MTNRSHLRFPEQAREAFSFLCDLGFLEIEALPTQIRYRNGDIEVSVYHGRRSYEVGAGITISETQYSISEIIRQTDKQFAEEYRYASMTTPEGVGVALQDLSLLMKRYCSLALNGDERFVNKLKDGRKSWSEEYALDVLVEQLRPEANEAFREKDYSTAIELYSQIRQRLTPSEVKKLRIAEKHIRTS